MRKLPIFICTMLLLLLSTATFSQTRKEKREARREARKERKERKDKDEYDNPMLRDQQAADMIKDPALGYVPYNRLLPAINQTIALKSANRPPVNANNNLLGDPLIWEERGPIYDSVGPSNGNGRGGGTGSTAGGHTAGRIRAFLLDTLNDPTGNTAFTGGVAGGLWKCTNFLSTINNWTPIDDRFDNLAISSICQDPTNPLIIYFSTGEPTDNADRVVGAGVWKSTDGGATFTYLPATANFMRCFKIGCDAAGNVYLACRTTTVPVNQQSGLFRSTDGGTTWVDITPNNLDPNSSASCTDFEFTASGILNAMFGYRAPGNVVNHRYTLNPVTVTPGTWSTSTGFRTSNAAAIRTEMAVMGEVLYAITINTAYNTDSCYKSINGGLTWTKQNTTVLPSGLGSGQGWYNISLAINPTNTNELISGGLDAYRSTNSGATWTRFTNWVSTAPYVHADHHYAQYWIAGGQTRMIMATDGGIFYSANNGSTFTSKNRNLGIKQFYSGAIHPAAGSPVLLAGAQDNGTHQLRNPGLSYSIEVTGGDGCIVHINQQNPLIQFGSYVYNQYRRTTNGGNTWSSVNLSSSQGLFVNPFDHDDAQNIMYCSNGPLGQLRRWINTNNSSTNSVITISDIGGTTSLTSLKVSPYTTNRLFFGTNTGKVYRMENANSVTTATANANTTDISGASFPAGTIICVNTGTDDNNIIATYSNYGVNNVWITDDGGVTWSAIDGNLPDMPVRWAMFQPGTNRKIYLATEAGIYTTINVNGAATQWLPETNFPTVSTYMLKLRASDSTIVAGTHGRGLWTAKIPPCVASQIDAQPVSSAFCEGSNATFTVTASGAIISYQWQVSTDGGVTFNDIPGANAATLTIPAVTMAMSGYQYKCNLDTDCSGLLTTNTVTLTVSPVPTVNAVSNQAVCAGSSTAAVSFSGSVPGTVYNWTNSNTAIGLAASGTGNIASFIATNNTNAPISGTITVTPVYTGAGTTCTGASTSFTITVNDNLQLLVVAVPGTTLCEGDPAALTVYESTGTAPYNLTQSTSTAITQFNSVSCNAGGLHTDNSYWRAYNLAPLGLPSALTVTSVTFGIEQAAGGTQPVTVNLYTQNAGPSFPGGTRTLVGSQNFNIPNQSLTLFTGNFATPVVVPNNAVLIVELFTPSGQATGRSFFIGSNTAAQTGPSYLSAAACGVPNPTDVAAIGFPNMHIILNLGGTVAGAGGIATGTFLWSPAAGLSSTTTNPVAASPMVTTTYTVVRTTGAGCTRSANITLTINQRPKITTQPANVTACATSNAVFSVTATGTAVTYQWQESTNGGVSYNNLNNAPPYSGVNTATLTITGVTQAMNNNRYRCVLSGTCPPGIPPLNISTGAILTVNGLPVIAITPTGPVCGGVPGINGTLITAGSSAPPVPGSVTVNSGNINLAIPDGPATWPQTLFPGVKTPDMAVSGIPANATITGMSVKLNLPHTYIADMVIVLKAPNGQVLNLDANISQTGGPGADFVNTTISSASTTALSSASPPYTGTFKADAVGATYVVLGFTFPGGPTTPAGYIPTVNSFSGLYSQPNGNYSLGIYDWGAGDLGTLTNWELRIDYTTPGGTGNPLTYTWSPAAGLYNDAAATQPYVAGTQTNQVYAAPTVNTVYTITGTDGTTGCKNTGTITVVYTPPAPTVVPASASICLGGPAQQLSILAATPVTQTFSSGPLNIPFTNNPTGISHTINVPVPPTAVISDMTVALNVTHTWDGDMAIVLKAPNNNILNLDYFLSGTGGTGATTGLTNTRFGSAPGLPAIGSSSNPYNGLFRADAVTGTGVFGPSGPTAFPPNVTTWPALWGTPNGNYTLAIYDGFAGDDGILTSWSVTMTYTAGAPPPVNGIWTPATGLYTDAAATIPYVAGTPAQTVYANPTVSTTYSVTVSSIGPDAFQTFTNPAPITITNGGSTPYPSNITVSGLPTTGASVSSVTLTGLSHTWSDDIDILLQSPTGQNVILMSDVGGSSAINNATYTFDDAGPAMGTGANPTGIYHPTNLVGTLGVEPDNWPAPGPGTVAQAAPALALFGNTANVNGVWKLFVVDDFAGDDGTISGGYSIRFAYPTPGCTSPARQVPVTVNVPINVTVQPVNATVCTDKVASFTVTVSGTAPTYQWQVSTDGGNTFTNIANGGVYSGVTTATLTVSAPPVTMNNYQYRCVISGAAPCGSATSFKVVLNVNPLPTVVITASPYTRLMPGLTTTLSSTVTPAAASTYTWLRNGAAVPGANSGTLNVNVDGMGDYRLRVTDVNGCTNTSNSITIADSASGKCFIYPNPTNGVFQVRYYSVANNVLPRSITIYNSNGDRVLTQFYTIGQPYDRMDVDMRKYGKGLYWVEIGDLNGNRLHMCRVVIQ